MLFSRAFLSFLPFHICIYNPPWNWFCIWCEVESFFFFFFKLSLASFKNHSLCCFKVNDSGIPEKPGFQRTTALFVILSLVWEKTTLAPSVKRRYRAELSFTLLTTVRVLGNSAPMLLERPRISSLQRGRISLFCALLGVYFSKSEHKYFPFAWGAVPVSMNSCLIALKVRSCGSPACHLSSVATVTWLRTRHGPWLDDCRAAQPPTGGCFSPG